MGAIAALRYAADHDDIAGVVTVSCPARWQLRTMRTVLAAAVTQTWPGRRYLERSLGVRVAPTRSRLESPEVLAGGCTARWRSCTASPIGSCPRSRHRGCTTRSPAGAASTSCRPWATPSTTVGTSTILAAVSWCLADPEARPA